MAKKTAALEKSFFDRAIQSSIGRALRTHMTCRRQLPDDLSDLLASSRTRNPAAGLRRRREEGGWRRLGPLGRATSVPEAEKAPRVWLRTRDSAFYRPFLLAPCESVCASATHIRAVPSIGTSQRSTGPV